MPKKGRKPVSYETYLQLCEMYGQDFATVYPDYASKKAEESQPQRKPEPEIMMVHHESDVEELRGELERAGAEKTKMSSHVKKLKKSNERLGRENARAKAEFAEKERQLENVNSMLREMREKEETLNLQRESVGQQEALLKERVKRLTPIEKEVEEEFRA